MSNLSMKLEKYKLEGLDCAGCANKIEESLKAKFITNKGINFTSKTVFLDPNRLQEAQEIINRIESGVIIEPVSLGTKAKKYVIEGIDCGNCASKISTKLMEQGLIEKPINFSTKTIFMYPHNLEEVKRVISQIEPGISIESQEERTIDKEIKDFDIINENKSELVRVSLAAITMLIGILYGERLHGGSYEILEYGIFVLGYLLVGGKVVWKALRNLVRGDLFDENFLMTIATLGAFAIHQLPEALGVMLFYAVGEFFQDIAVNRSRRSIQELMNIRPDYANLLVDGQAKRVSPEEVRIGSIIVVKPGEKVPLDGKVIEGSSFVDTSALTGESVPRKVKKEDGVLAGSVNTNGLLTVEVQKEFGDSSVAKILDLVENAGSRKAPTEAFITKFSRYYTPAVVLISIAIALIPPLLISGENFSEWVYRALTILVISCPCALVISIPLGYFGGIGGASRKGILIKGANYLEALNALHTIALDKTGTITKGVFNVTEIVVRNDFDRETLLRNAAYAEAQSNHPIAKSIIREFDQDINYHSIQEYQEVAGHGIMAIIEDNRVLVGNYRLLQREDIKINALDTAISGTLVYIAINGVYAGYIIIADEIKSDSIEAVTKLKKLGIKEVIMLTGDHGGVAKEIAEKTGVDKFYSDLLPEDKVSKIEEIEKRLGAKRKAKVAFVGDGINDAPVITKADIGIAMGGLGSDAAIEAADIVIMEDKLSKIATAIGIAKFTRKIIIQNIVFAMGIKGVFIGLGAIGVATMWEAVFADVGVTILAVLNASRVLKF